MRRIYGLLIVPALVLAAGPLHVAIAQAQAPAAAPTAIPPAPAAPAIPAAPAPAAPAADPAIPPAPPAPAAADPSIPAAPAAPGAEQTIPAPAAPGAAPAQPTLPSQAAPAAAMPAQPAVPGGAAPAPLPTATPAPGAASAQPAAAAAGPASPASFPKPSPYPKSWELKFSYGKPKRVVVQVPGKSVPQAFWYLTYNVTNDTDREQLFLPMLELATEDGKLTRSDVNIPRVVFDTIKRQEGNRFLEPAQLIGGELRIGEDQAKDGVAIWPEVTTEMGNFSIFVQGLSGETATVPGPNNKPTILRKTLQLNYLIRGDAVYPGEDEVNENPKEWVMR
ncbi:MAG TPA: hypothetical protein VER17_10910 [Tepidisphaeraceae bacterium]|nr:hypothetical protein [Tepidisphaeraceae bacterium]